ncbi:uncharacterized protein LOC106180166 [Lingula anatina]|uniref:Uncharacterized protein LOC106180166 n=1 Tax=Lingula anatina TaxID=7574 RepID=A0A1S3KA71_LINAN|nr:uncharacterized protein LOC106180166 [Lingula anatina]|eukprot:XP_013419525.1 uncharacterized protein LOC106180166 [Lingula anatina]
MTGYLGVLLIAVILTGSVLRETQADCCYSIPREGFCYDCTRKTPYCGYGKCNIFGCACDGGCRKNCGYKMSSYSKIINNGTVGWLAKCDCTNKRSVEDAHRNKDVDADRYGKEPQG